MSLETGSIQFTLVGAFHNRVILMAAVWCVCVYAFLVCLIVNHLRAYTHIRSVDATYFPAAVSRSGLQNLLAGYFLGFIYILTFQLAITCLHALCLFERADNKTAKT